MLEVLFEIIKFLRQRKRLWMFPIVLIMVLIGALLIAVQGSVIAPFVYTLF